MSRSYRSGVEFVHKIKAAAIWCQEEVPDLFGRVTVIMNEGHAAFGDRSAAGAVGERSNRVRSLSTVGHVGRAGAELLIVRQVALTIVGFNENRRDDIPILRVNAVTRIGAS